jgi:hypothetical protein
VSIPGTKNILLYRNYNRVHNSRRPGPLRDVSRSSRCVGLGMRWTLRRQVLAPDENAAADGEVVWSWRRDPGVYPARLCGHGNGDNKGRSPGRARISRKPLRGESRDVSAVPVRSVCVLALLSAHGDAGAVGARLSLRPLISGGNEMAQPGRKPAAGTGTYVSTSLRGAKRRSNPSCRKQKAGLLRFARNDGGGLFEN